MDTIVYIIVDVQHNMSTDLLTFDFQLSAVVEKPHIVENNIKIAANADR